MDRPSDKAAALGEIARGAGAVAFESRKRMVREIKADGTIVTNCDRDVEIWLRGHLQAFVPGSSVWGEEFGHDGNSPEGLWVVDPIDGTSNFSYGSPLWGISIGLLQGNEIVLGAVYLPDLGEMYVSERGTGAFLNNRALAPIPPGPILDQELVTYGDYILRTFPNLKPPGKMRLTGAFVVDGTYTAMQRFRGLLGCRERLYDVAACVLFGLELGADVRYADGSIFDLAELSEPIQISKPWVMFPRDSGLLYKPLA